MYSQRRGIIVATSSSVSIGFFQRIIRRMKEDGYDVYALSSPGKELSELCEKENIHILPISIERRISILHDLVSLFRITKAFCKERPLMVHSMTPKAGLLCMMAGWLTGVPVRIHTFTGLIWPTSTGFKRALLKFTDRITCACATHIIPEGKGVMNDLRNGRITKKPMKVLGYGNIKGVDTDLYNPSKYELSDSSKFTFLFVGRIVRDKGINELVDAFDRLSKEMPTIQLNLVGNYEDNLDPISDKSCHIIESNPNIHFKGIKHGEDLVKEYASADCFVLPSYREGFPNSVLEAGAMGLPCIVTNINGCNEIIEEGKNGIIINSKDTEALLSAMREIANNKELYQKLASNAREMIVSRFEQSFVLKCQMDFYHEVLSKKGYYV